jgi:hypothetical protein
MVERWEMTEEQGFRYDVVHELKGIREELHDLGRSGTFLGFAVFLMFLTFLVYGWFALQNYPFHQ